MEHIDLFYTLWPIAGGVFGFFGGVLVYRTMVAQRIPRKHAKLHERIMDRLHYRLNLMAEITHVDQELWELKNAAPKQQRELIYKAMEDSQMVPPALRKLARLFGFDIPDVKMDTLPEELPPHPADLLVAQANGESDHDAWSN